MNIDSIQNGYVIDHITAGTSMELYNALKLDTLDCCVAIIRNVTSTKMGKKDIIKIDALIDLDMDVLGYIDAGVTVNIVRNGVIEEKCNIRLPEEIRDVIRCDNPRCITSIEQELPQIFRLADEEHHLYRCIYCDTAAKPYQRII